MQLRIATLVSLVLQEVQPGCFLIDTDVWRCKASPGKDEGVISDAAELSLLGSIVMSTGMSAVDMLRNLFYVVFGVGHNLRLPWAGVECIGRQTEQVRSSIYLPPIYGSARGCMLPVEEMG
jgi:hypothetical protein